ncbi:hypothetical protein CCMA1212_007110 [Trichoderma ghanense]|uniref:Uncharacterized protein n=1 Tax=Trichoderma ghanense TaxID=65468 RepID=A0ABY2GXH8_9HYPO
MGAQRCNCALGAGLACRAAGLACTTKYLAQAQAQAQAGEGIGCYRAKAPVNWLGNAAADCPSAAASGTNGVSSAGGLLFLLLLRPFVCLAGLDGSVGQTQPPKGAGRAEGLGVLAEYLDGASLCTAVQGKRTRGEATERSTSTPSFVQCSCFLSLAYKLVRPNASQVAESRLYLEEQFFYDDQYIPAAADLHRQASAQHQISGSLPILDPFFLSSPELLDIKTGPRCKVVDCATSHEDRGAAHRDALFTALHTMTGQQAARGAALTCAGDELANVAGPRLAACDLISGCEDSEEKSRAG